MDFPNYMILNPLHIQFHNIPKKQIILDHDSVSFTTAWIPCIECIDIAIDFFKKDTPEWVKGIICSTHHTKLNLK